jgi:hypothetical protein
VRVAFGVRIIGAGERVAEPGWISIGCRSDSSVKALAIHVDDVRMNHSALGDGPRVYRITPWPIRIGAPFAAIVVMAGLLEAGAAAFIPVPIVLAAAWICAAEWCGLVVANDGIESRMTRRYNSFRYAWTDIDGFVVIDNGAQVAIVMRLCDGSSKLLPSTRAWRWDKRNVEKILTALVRAQDEARVKAAALG